MAEFREEDHDRDQKGRFTAGALSLAAAQWANKRDPEDLRSARTPWAKSDIPLGTFAPGWSKKDKGAPENISNPLQTKKHWVTRGSHWGRGGRQVEEEIPIPAREKVKGKFPEKLAGKLPDKTKGPGEIPPTGRARQKP